MTTTFLVPKNNASAKLSADITAIATSLTVQSGEGARFPSTYPFNLTIDNEIVKVTSRSTDTMTVTRAQESTSAAAHSAGATVQLNITAKAISDLNTAVNALESATTPAHKTSHQDGGADEISVAGLSGLLADGQTPLAHNTSHQSGGADAVKLDDLSAPDDTTDLDARTSKHGLMPKTDKSKLDGIQASAVALSTVKADSDIADAITKKHANTNDPLADEKAALAGTSGTPSVSNKYVTNADSRNSDARTPSAHKTSHQSGGSDAVKLDDLSAPDDNTDLNASTSKHGLCPKAPNNVLQFLRGDGAFAALPLFACKAYRSSDLSIANASYTVVDLNAEEFDTDTMHDLVTNPSRLTVKTAGKYLIVANAWFAANATGIRIARIDVNGLGYSIASTNAVGSSYYTQFIVMHLHQCAVNDYIQLNVYQNSGGSLNLLTNSFLAAFRLGA